MNFDESQQSVIDFCGGRAIVLAAPGCGKTEILSQRILKAHKDYGVSFADMLCITFTNRASREMKDRVRKVVGDVLDDLFVGNLHRFCIRFLFDNQILPPDVGIMDESDQLDALVHISGAAQLQSWEVKAVTDRVSHIFEVENSFPEGLHMHRHANERCEQLARQFIEFKRVNRLVDFDDLLLLTYRAMMRPDFQNLYSCAKYRWIQVDEVQDLNPLQLAIVEKLVAPDLHSLVFLGDERQAIYSFLGTETQSVQQIAATCGGNVFSLANNYRSPMYLLDMLNDYAKLQLGIDVNRLPHSSNNVHIDDALLAINCQNAAERCQVLSTLAMRLCNAEVDETVGVLARSNNDVNAISQQLSLLGVSHFKTSNSDMFKTVGFKTLYSHFAVVANPLRYSDWPLLLARTKVFDSLALARRCIVRMRELGIVPSDLIAYADSTYLMQFVESVRNKEVVVFDTETTGLDVFADDVIQIAAIKMRNGQVVPGSEFDIIIETSRVIPAMLGNDIVNPMVEEYARREHLSPQEGFARFLDYVGDCELLGHNVNYDIAIVRSNIERRTQGLSFCPGVYWDSLRASRLINPKQKVHKLAELLKLYGLEGVNSHNALDDILATFSLVKFLCQKAETLLPEQRKFISHPVVKDVQARMRQNYSALYAHSTSLMASTVADEEHGFCAEFDYVYRQLTSAGFVPPIENVHYMDALFRKVVFASPEPFAAQLINHLYDLRTFNESDLYQNEIVQERVQIMTIHKSKGLEFDNVLVADASEGVIPHARATSKMDLDESARMLYVALSRARKRVVLTYQRQLSRFISGPVRAHFEDWEGASSLNPKPRD